METELTFHLHYTFKKITLQEFISGYKLRKKKDPHILKVIKNGCNKTEYLISKKIPYYLRLFLHVSKIEYLESMCFQEDKVEINVWQTLGSISSRANATVTYNDFSNEIVMSVLFKLNNIPDLFKSNIKSYIVDEFQKELLEMSKYF